MFLSKFMMCSRNSLHAGPTCAAVSLGSNQYLIVVTPARSLGSLMRRHPPGAGYPNVTGTSCHIFGFFLTKKAKGERTTLVFKFRSGLAVVTVPIVLGK